MSLKFHPLSEIFPLLPPNELDDLTADIKLFGQRAPITIYEGKILDGRNRYRACLKAEIEPKLREFAGADPIAFVISVNLRRRHLDDSQRALIAARIEELSQGGDRRSGTKRITRTEAASIVKVGTRSVARAKKVLLEGTPADIRSIESGKKSVSSVADQIGKSAAPSEVSDKLGYPVPEPALAVWHEGEEYAQIQRSIAHVRTLLRDLDANRPALAEVNVNGLVAQIKNIHNEFGLAIPYVVCPICQGIEPRTCALCKTRGVISKFMWDTCVPEEMKEMRKKAIAKIKSK